MPTFTPAGDVPSGYAGLFSNLVRGPNGTIVMAPQFSGPASTADLYRGIIPTPSPSDPIGPGTDWASLVGAVGDPLYFGEPNTSYGQAPTSVAQTRSEQVRPRVVPTIPITGNAGGAAALQAIANLVGVPQPAGSIAVGKDQTRMPETPILAFSGDEGNVPLPRVRPILPTDTSGGGVKINVPYSGASGGGQGGSGDGSYVVKKGDTLWDISQRVGIPVATLAANSGISNPNKIKPGQVINFGSLSSPSSGGVRPMPAPMFSRTAMSLSAPFISAVDPWQGLRVNDAPSVPGLVAASPSSVSQARATSYLAAAPANLGPKYPVSTAPGTFNRETGTWN